MTIPEAILETLRAKGPLTRRNLAILLDTTPQNTCKALSVLLKHKEIVSKGRRPVLFAIADQNGKADILHQLRHAKRYRAGAVVLVEAEIAEKAARFIEGL